MSNLKGIENGRAQFAYECVEKAVVDCKDKAKEYKSYCKKIPMMIKTNGLGNTLAFMKSKGNERYTLIYSQITEWFTEERKYLLNIEETDDLVQKVVGLESKDYRIVTIEVLSLFNWLKRFADGLIEGEDDE